MRGLGWIPATPQGWERLSSALQSGSHRCSKTGGPREANFGRVPASFRGAGVPGSCIRGPTQNRICSAYRTPAGRDNPAAPPVSCWSPTGQPSRSSSQQGLPLQPWGPAPGRRFLNSWAWNRGGTRSSGARECRACRLASCMLSPALPRPPRWGAAWLTPQVMAAESCSKLNRVSGPATGQGGVGSGGQTQGRARPPDQTQRISRKALASSSCQDSILSALDVLLLAPNPGCTDLLQWLSQTPHSECPTCTLPPPSSHPRPP